MNMLRLLSSALPKASIYLLLSLLTLLTACLQPAQAQNQGSIVTLTADDNGKQVQLTIGNQLVVRLPTVSPRYGWRLAQSYPGMLTFAGSTSLPGLISGVPGAPATQELRFQATGPGGFDLALISALPGTGYAPLGDYFHVYVTIDQPGVAKNMSVTEYGNHGHVTVNKGDQLIIKLGSTVGSTSHWEAIPAAGNIVQLVKQSEQPEKKKPKPGSPSDVTFQFQALNPGQTTVRFLYRDASDNSASPSRDFELQVDVPQPPK